MSKVSIWTDGASSMKKVNGEYIRGAGGAGFAVIENGKITHFKAKDFSKTTNNHCELYAIKMALDYFLQHYSREDELEINSDSAYCINMLKENGWVYSWEKNGWTRGKKHEPIENLELIKEIFDLLKKVKVEFIKIKGHSGNWANDFVDKLAVNAKKNCSCR